MEPLHEQRAGQVVRVLGVQGEDGLVAAVAEHAEDAREVRQADHGLRVGGRGHRRAGHAARGPVVADADLALPAQRQVSDAEVQQGLSRARRELLAPDEPELVGVSAVEPLLLGHVVRGLPVLLLLEVLPVAGQTPLARGRGGLRRLEVRPVEALAAAAAAEARQVQVLAAHAHRGLTLERRAARAAPRLASRAEAAGAGLVPPERPVQRRPAAAAAEALRVVGLGVAGQGPPVDGLAAPAAARRRVRGVVAACAEQPRGSLEVVSAQLPAAGRAHEALGVVGLAPSRGVSPGDRTATGGAARGARLVAARAEQPLLVLRGVERARDPLPAPGARDALLVVPPAERLDVLVDQRLGAGLAAGGPGRLASGAPQGAAAGSVVGVVLPGDRLPAAAAAEAGRVVGLALGLEPLVPLRERA